MNVGILGTGIVGRTIGTVLVRRGERVCMGSRVAGNELSVEWAREAGAGASEGTFADAARYGEVVFNCTAGAATLDAIRAAGPESLRGKFVIDVANPLDFSHAMPPTLTVCNTDSLGEQVQRALPGAKVVKALNTVNSQVMVRPSLVDGEHALFVCGNDADAKERVTELLEAWFGWPRERVIDLGDITASRGTEMLLPLWIRLYASLGTGTFNFQVMRARSARGTPEQRERFRSLQSRAH